MATTEPQTEPQTKAEGVLREKFSQNWADTRLAHEGMMLDKIQRQTQIVEQLAAQTRDGKFSSGEVPATPEDDMGVSIGNEIHNHYPAATPPEDRPPEVATPTIEAQPVGSLAKWILAASLLLGGATGAGVAVLINQARSPDPPTTTPHVVDTNTTTDVMFPGSGE